MSSSLYKGGGSPADAAPGAGWRIATILVGIFIGLFGLAMTGGGAWLVTLSGSWYYALAGVGLLACAVLLFMGRRLAQVVMGLVWLASLTWALAEVGLDGWGLVPRVVGVTVMLMLVLLVSPSLNHRAQGGK